MYCAKTNSVQKIVNDTLLKTLVSELPSGIIWVDVPSLSVVSREHLELPP